MHFRKKTIIIAALLLFYVTVAFTAEIHEAAKKGNLDKLKTLLSGDPGLLNLKDSKGIDSQNKNRRLYIW